MSIKNLVINTSEVEEKPLELIIKKYFSYHKDGEIIVTNNQFYKLTGEKKIMHYLTAILGRKFLGLDNPELGTSNKQLEKKLNMKGGSVRAHISLLKNRGLVETEKKQHRITSRGVAQLQERKENDKQ